MRGEQQQSQAKLLDQVAERAERVGRYLGEADGDRLLRDVERMARSRPWVGAGAGMVLGFLAARFVKASSSRRYEADGDGDVRVAVSDPQPAPVLPAAYGVSDRGGGSGGEL
jgi:hypothetical protein